MSEERCIARNAFFEITWTPNSNILNDYRLTRKCLDLANERRTQSLIPIAVNLQISYSFYNLFMKKHRLGITLIL